MKSLGALILGNEGAPGTLQQLHRGVGVQADEEGIAQRAGGAEIANVSGV